MYASLTAPIELYVRSLSPSGGRDEQERVLDQLESLTRRKAIPDYAVHVVGDEIAHGARAGRTRVGQFIRHRLLTVHHWAAENGFRCSPCIQHRTCFPLSARVPYDVTSLPTRMLVEYDDNSIVFVTPICIGDRNYHVRDHLAAIDPDEPTVIPERDAATPLFDPVRRVWRESEITRTETRQPEKQSEDTTMGV